MNGNRMTARMFVGMELRQAREAKSISRAKLGEALFVSESLIAKWEGGRAVPGPRYIEQLREILDLADMLIRVIEKLVPGEIGPEWFGRWPQVEQQAEAFWWFEATVVPGLLQTEDYARAILQAADLPTDLEDLLTMRMERQEILAKEDPPMLVALISESVLRHNIGGSKVMYDQLIDLADKAERDNIIVQIIPDNSPACAGFLSAFIIAGFDGREVGYVDNQLDGATIETPESVGRLRRFFDRFRADALSRTESIGLIRKAAEQWAT